MTDKITPERDSRLGVLVVDDSPRMIEALSILLEDHRELRLLAGVSTGAEAEHAVQALQPDIVVMDVELPDSNGIEVAQRILARNPHLCVVALTAHESLDAVKRAMRTGIAEFITKEGRELSRLGELLLDAYRRHAHLPPANRARIWMVQGVRAAAGGTSLAVNVAFYLATLSHRVLLIDLDLLQGDVALYLNGPAEAEKNAALWFQEPSVDPVDGLSLVPYIRTFSLSTSRSPRLDLIESPCSPSMLENSLPDRAGAVLDIASLSYDFVVVDLPPLDHLDPCRLSLADRADRLYLVVPSDLLGFKSAVRCWRSLPTDWVARKRPQLLLSEHLPRSSVPFEALLDAEARAQLEVKQIPGDSATLESAALRGVPALFANAASPYSRFIVDLVDDALRVHTRSY